MWLIRDKNWREKVYKINYDDFDRDDWEEIKKEVIYRDKLHCKSCEKRMMYGNLSVHHIIPRVEGGQNNIENLITLCFPCHDEIEQTDIRTATEIYGYNTPAKKYRRKLDREIRDNLSQEFEEMLERIDAQRPKWHASVYGGCKTR